MDNQVQKLIMEVRNLGEAIEQGDPQKITDVYLFHVMPLLNDLEDDNFSENSDDDDYYVYEDNIPIDDKGYILSEHDEV